MSLHDILDKLDGALGKVRDAIGHDLGPVDGVLAELRTHADKEAALLEQQAIGDVHQVESDAAAAAGPIVQEVESDAKDLADQAATDVQSALGGSAAPSTPDQAPETPAPAEAEPAAPSEPADEAAAPQTDTPAA